MFSPLIRNIYIDHCVHPYYNSMLKPLEGSLWHPSFRRRTIGAEKSTIGIVFLSCECVVSCCIGSSKDIERKCKHIGHLSGNKTRWANTHTELQRDEYRLLFTKCFRTTVQTILSRSITTLLFSYLLLTLHPLDIGFRLFDRSPTRSTLKLTHKTYWQRSLVDR